MTVHIPSKTIWQLVWSALGFATVLVVSKKYDQLLKTYGPYIEVEGQWRCKFRRRDEGDSYPEWEQADE